MAAETTRRPDAGTMNILRTLVGFPTISRDGNLDLIGWVYDYLASFGIESRLTYSADRRKANLFASIGEGNGGIVLSGHTDVVPVDGQDWTSDPFTLTEREGLLYGRGTCDMKGFLAVALARVPSFMQTRRPQPLHLALSFDEEVGCLGIPHLLADLKEAGIRPAACIVGEPTSMRAVVGHKEGSVHNVEVEGLAVHSSLAPQGVNAVEYAARIVMKIWEIGQRLKGSERWHEGYEVPYTTLQTGVIQGGFAANIVPRSCALRFDIRALPWTDSDALVAEIQAYIDEVLVPEMRLVHPGAGIRMTRKGRVPGFALDVDAPLTRHVQRLARSNAAPAYVTFGSEAGLFQQAGIPAIICGPGSISQAHKPDEYVALDQLALCEDFLDRLAVTALTVV